MTVLKERRWEVMEVGETFGPIEVEVTDALVKAYVYSCDDFDPAWLQASGDVARVAPPLLLCREARDVIRTGYDIASGGAGMHTKHACEIHGCAAIGERVRITGEHVEKFIKREKQYIVLESTVRGADGRTLLVQRSTHIRGLKPGVAKAAGPEAQSDEGAHPAPPPGAGFVAPGAPLAAGMTLQPITKKLSQEQLTVFAGTDWPNIHNAREVARAAGLRDCVASGLQTLAFASELMARHCGPEWREGGTMDVAFTAPLFVDEQVRVGGKVVEVLQQEGRRRLVVELTCVTEAGVQVLGGKASGWMAA